MRRLIVVLFILSQFLHATGHIKQEEHLQLQNLIPKVISYSHQEDFLNNMKVMNHKYYRYSNTDLKKYEYQWQQTDRTGRNKLQQSVFNNPISKYLRVIENENKGLFTDLIALNNKGIVVGMSSQSNKFFRGYEEKFTKPWNMGPSGSYMSPYLFSPAVGKSLVYLSVTITDRQYQPLGVLVVGIDKDILHIISKD